MGLSKHDSIISWWHHEIETCSTSYSCPSDNEATQVNISKYIPWLHRNWQYYRNKNKAKQNHVHILWNKLHEIWTFCGKWTLHYGYISSHGLVPHFIDIYTIVWFLRAPRWYIGPTAMPRAAVTPIAPERSEGAIGCDSCPRHCRRDDIPAWGPNKITLLSLLPLDLMMYHRFISFMCAVQSREGRWFNPRYCL